MEKVEMIKKKGGKGEQKQKKNVNTKKHEFWRDDIILATEMENEFHAQKSGEGE